MNMSDMRFRVLVVDDQHHVHAKAAEELGKLGSQIEIRSATVLEEATNLAGSEFFHLAFVDLEIRNEKGGSARGTAVKRHLNTVSPSCRIFVMTKHLPKYAAEVLSLLEPSFLFAGLVDKTSGSVEWFRPFVELPFNQWRARLLEVEGLDHVVNAVLGKAQRADQQLAASEPGPLRVRRDSKALSDEISWILMGLFGAIGEPMADTCSLLTLRLLRSGFSSAVVMEALPWLRFVSLGEAVKGNRCVVKIGPRSEIRKEADRYEQIVRFGVAMDHRVELLGYTEADAFAGVCYSFAGGNASGLRTLDDLLADENSDAWRKVIQQIFAPAASNWYSVKSEIGALREYFVGELHVRLERCYDSFAEWVESFSRIGVVRRNKNKLTIDNESITLPSRELLAEHGLTSRCAACLTHGDLHGGNVVVDDLERAYFIDYRNSGVGPRLIDFAALHATARFAHVESFKPPTNVWPRTYDPELVKAIATTVRGEGRAIAGRLLPGERWIEVVAALERARLGNFPDSDRAESLWTNFAYCLSLFRLVHMEWYRKLRLLTWLSALTVALQRLR